MLDSYIIHIIRGRKDKPHTIIGVVEEVGIEEKKAFTNYDELWKILNPRNRSKEETWKKRKG